MGLSKYESEIKVVQQNINILYGRLSDLRNFESLKQMLSNPVVMEQIASKVPADKLEEAKKQLDNMKFDQDSVFLSSPVGELTLRIVEREEPKCIKFASEGSPIPLYLWIQLIPVADYETKMRVTVGAEVNFFLKGVVAKPLQQAADGLANILCVIR